VDLGRVRAGAQGLPRVPDLVQSEPSGRPHLLKELRRRYGLKPIWTDDAAWYPEACRWSRLEHHVYRQEWKNLIERMNQSLKDRLELFDDNFPCFREECELEHVNNWIRVFRFYHNYIRTNGEIGKAPLQRDTLPEYQRFTQLLMEVSLR